jgi:polar amino acid transport system substrate-binding protein
VVEAVKARQVDLAFVAIDPVRGADMDYTAPYVIIEGAYMVRNDSALQRNEDVDRAGTRVVVGRGSAYDLFLTRELKSASLVRAPTSPAVTDLFLEQKLEVAAGVKQQLEADAKRVGGRAPAARALHGDRAGHGRAQGPSGGAGLAQQLHRGDEGLGLRRFGAAAARHRRRRRRAATRALNRPLATDRAAPLPTIRRRRLRRDPHERFPP